MKPAVFFESIDECDCILRNRHDLFAKIEQANIEDTRQLFGEILTTRLKQLDQMSPETVDQNIAGKLDLPEYQTIAGQPSAHVPESLLWIEQEALGLFNNFADFWCEFELHKIRKKYIGSTHKRLYRFSYNEENYRSQIMTDIKNSKKIYMIPHEIFLMELPDAVIYINLSSSVKERKWYEILISIDSLNDGPHFIMSSLIDGEPYELILSTAKIQLWNKVKEWLYFSPYFISSKWIPYDKINFENELSSEIKVNIAHIKFDDTCSYEYRIARSITNKNSLCEIIRLTVCGTLYEKTYILYFAQKLLLIALKEKNIKFAFIIFDHPIAAAFYNKLGSENFIYLSVNQQDHTEKPVYKGLWIVDNLLHQFVKYSFKYYKKIYYMSKKNTKGAFNINE